MGGVLVLDIYHFSYGWITPLMAYVMSVIGSLLGLQCAVRARRQGEVSTGWLIAAALAIGGTGIWVMHFIAMLGFSIEGAQIRYDVLLTLFSALTAVVVVGIGLFIVIRPQPTVLALLSGGAITGIGVGAMHYTGMYAMKSNAHVRYELPVVGLSMLIAVVAATVALWFTLRVKGAPATVAAALIMGVAVCGMHYTGMASMRAQHTGHTAPPAGAEPGQLLAPLLLVISIATMLLLISVSLTTVEDSIVDLPRLRRAARQAEKPQPVAPPAAVGLKPQRPQPKRKPYEPLPTEITNSYWPPQPGSSTAQWPAPARDDTGRPRVTEAHNTRKALARADRQRLLANAAGIEDDPVDDASAGYELPREPGDRWLRWQNPS
ncbi:MHYT domain-containing protein [Nocardia sp. XZ_19_385]|uniref:MHYT domain-containing protein n=1 Tax=Nocardia sp. XZ_19_385 TaxID=2769488 RepID=UPI0028167A52|nr:MHYT domain-containing protein [Nocardia sp. XZ_19_385]